MATSANPEQIGSPSEPKKTQKPNLKVSDSRKSPDFEQAKNLSRRIEKEGILTALKATKAFLGKYSTRSPQELSVNIVDGALGEGSVRGTQIDIQMPSQADAVSQLRASLRPAFGEISKQTAGELALAVATSTILHEGVHAILESSPTSPLAADYERAAETPNTDGETLTLLDEGIAYAIQGIYATAVKPIGSLAPRIDKKDNPEVKKRKALGEKLKPKVVEYMKVGKRVDDEFLAFAAQAIKEAETSGG